MNVELGRHPGVRLPALQRLLDRQVVDSDETPVCKVDDMELNFSPQPLADGSRPLTPEVVALLVGPRWLGRRLGGVLGRVLRDSTLRMRREGDPVLSRIPVTLVGRVDSAVHLSCPRSAVGQPALEAWVRAHLIDKIPGSGDDPD